MAFKEHRLTVPAKVEKIEIACEFVSGVARAMGMNDESIYHCYLSVEEICTNIIEHGYGYSDAPHAKIEVLCEEQQDRLTIIIMDDADQFNPLLLRDPDPTASLMERKEGGWGVYFVKKFMDRVDYRFAANRNQFVMEKMC